jgi:quinoprotein glucose dehydrogenase
MQNQFRIVRRIKNTIVPILLAIIPFISGCQNKKVSTLNVVKEMDPKQSAALAKSIEASVTPELAEGLTLHLWGGDSLIADPVAIDIDDQGRIYYTRTNRQKNSELDIRGHQEWEIESIHLQTVEDRRTFLHKILSPENSKQNEWLADLNKDGSHDWKDLTVEKEQVYRVEDISGDGVADRSQLVVEDFNEEVTDVMGGALVDRNDIYIAVAPDLWKLTDTNGDGVPDEKKSLSHGYGIHIGFGGHGMSGVEMGPEGKIYWQIGDIGFNGGKGVDGQSWEYPNSGVLVRANPDGSDFEIFAYGIRNTHEFVFDEYANIISEDNDGDHPGEEERIVYIVNGADIGWRSNWQYGKYRDPNNNTYKVWMDEKMFKPRFEGQPAYIVPTIANYVSGPAGMVYNPGTALGPEWKKTFFVAEFVGNQSRSGIHAFKLNPKGSSFELGDHKNILRGILATGIDFGPDGGLYVADWITGWNTKDFGRIWKLDATAADPARKETRTLLAADFGSYENEKLGDILKNADMRVRQKAQFELVKRGEDGLEVLKKSIEQTENQLARVNGIFGVSQFIRKDSKYGKLLIPFLTDKDPEIRAQAAKWLGDVKYKESGEALVPLLRDDNSRARFFAAEALGRIAFEPAVKPLIELLRANNDEEVYLRHAGSLALARIGKPEPVIALSKDPSAAVRMAAVLALRRMKNAGVSNFLNDANEYIVTEAARAINDDLSIEGALPALGDLLITTPFRNEALIRRSISANIRTGNEKAMQNLIAYISTESAPVAMRVEALDALSTWAKPSVLDRVDGRYRGVVERSADPVKASAGDMTIRLLKHKELSLRQSAAKAIAKLNMSNASEALFTNLKNDPSPEMRIEALKALATLKDEKIGAAIQQALSDKEKTVRVAGLDLLAKTSMAKPLMVSLLSDVIKTRTTEEKQAALITLGSLPIENSQPVFDQLLDKLSSGNLLPEIHLELSEAIDSTHSSALISRYKGIHVKSSSDSLLAAYEGSLLGGDPHKGGQIFYRNQTAQCLRCHSFNDYGGNAGPRLNGVAARLTRQQILEALVNPSARIAAGFGVVNLDLRNGKTIHGILQQEKPDVLVLKIGDKPDTIVRKDQVVKRTNSESSMPPMRFLLSKREIRDLVSFLSTLKEDK